MTDIPSWGFVKGAQPGKHQPFPQVVSRISPLLSRPCKLCSCFGVTRQSLSRTHKSGLTGRSPDIHFDHVTPRRWKVELWLITSIPKLWPRSLA